MAKRLIDDAKRAKKDEFYTRIEDIEKELRNYKDQLEGKTIFCNCDDSTESHFFKYFHLNFKRLGIKRLISTHFESTKPSYKLEIVCDSNKDGSINDLEIVETPLKQNGDFRSPECIELMKEADVVITNPPFSLFREYVAQLMRNKKEYVPTARKSLTWEKWKPIT